MAIFDVGNKVEVCSNQQGFKGSFYEATVVSCNVKTGEYQVKYKNLVTNELRPAPLIETVTEEEVRPRPPRLPNPAAFGIGEKVDAFDRDGWWVGKVVKLDGQKYEVCFDHYIGDEPFWYHITELRRHLDYKPQQKKKKI